MCTTNTSTIRRDVLKIIEINGQISHEELCDKVGLEWDELQTVIKHLRIDGSVVINLNRCYEINK